MSKRVRVAYQGEPGAFSETAARQLLGDGPMTVPYRSFEEMFDSVTSGEANCLVVPIENSLAGSIHRNYDLLMEAGLTIVGETYLRIGHNLLASADATLESIRRVYSHPVALAQCGRFLRGRTDVEAVPAHDTAGAVRLVLERGRSDEAAIASESAAAIYGAKTLAAGIEDNRENFTRFFLAAPPDSGIEPLDQTSPQRWKTSLVLRVDNKPGALFRALGAFALLEIDLSKIESRPIEGRPWEYAFYVDVIGHVSDERLSCALDSLRVMAELVKVLGCYRTAA